jgi:hypothetical protein
MIDDLRNMLSRYNKACRASTIGRGTRCRSPNALSAYGGFGQAKEARGFSSLSLRGLRMVQREWTFVCMCSNLLKLVNAPLSLHAVLA